MTKLNEHSSQSFTASEPFVFISYARQDGYFVYPEINRLEREGYKIWYDKDKIRPSRLWSEEIRKAIEACSCLVVFLTHAAVRSVHVLEEIDQALSSGIPFVCIYWEKVELPPGFQERIQRIQTLERYALRRREYEEPLSKVLAEYVGKPKPFEEEKKYPDAPPEPPPDTPSGVPPKVIFFTLILVAVIFFFISIVVFTTPFFAAQSPTDPLANRFGAFVTGSLFMVIAAGLAGTAFMVHRIYIRRKKNG